MRLDGVRECHANYRKEEVSVAYDPELVTMELLCENIRELGYEPDTDAGRTLQIVSILLILLALYLIASHLGWLQIFNIFPSIETSMGYGMLFVIGVLTSVHCIAMCGGINLTQSTLASRGEGQVLRANLLYNIGRILSYTVVGGIAGGIGSVLSLGGRMRGAVAVAAGCIMILMSLQMLGVFKVLRNVHLHLPARVYAAGSRIGAKNSSLWIGLLNGLMPCGPLQSMQIYALSTGSVAAGALSMLLFSLGTVPLMFGFGLISGKLNRRYAGYMLTVSGILIFVMGLSMMGNGLSLSGVRFPVRRTEIGSTAMTDGDIQLVRSEIDYGSYEPITVKAGTPVQWTIHVPEGRLNGCNGEILVPEYGLDVKLSEGDNIVEFTPEAAGTVPYSCWMGMIRSSIEVTE